MLTSIPKYLLTTLNFVLSSLAFLIIKFYKLFLSPYFGNNCRYHPTCSSYTYESIQKFGFFTGGFLGLKRIIKCNPLFKGGLDLVPDKIIKNKK